MWDTLIAFLTEEGYALVQGKEQDVLDTLTRHAIVKEWLVSKQTRVPLLYLLAKVKVITSHHKGGVVVETHHGRCTSSGLQIVPLFGVTCHDLLFENAY